MCTPFRLSLIVIGIFALGFQIAAICVKAWVRVGVEQNSNGYVQDSSMHIGLWGLDVCEGLRGWFGENCIHFSFENNFYTDTGVLGRWNILFYILLLSNTLQNHTCLYIRFHLLNVTVMIILCLIVRKWVSRWSLGALQIV